MTRRSECWQVWASSLLLVFSLLGDAGCGSSTNGGALGRATFQATACGGVLSDLAGCDLSRNLALGGLVDVRASRNSDGSLLSLRSEQPAILGVQDIGGGQYTITGKSAGSAQLSAFSSSGDVDHLTIQVAEIYQIDYSTLSNGSGSFKLQPNGDIDGTFALASGVTNFSLIFLQVDSQLQPMLGRDACSYMLSTGLMFQPGKDQPHALQFDLSRPPTGSYSILVRAKYGPGRFKLQIGVN